MSKINRLFAFLLWLYPLRAAAQDVPIGVWRSHLPYNSAVAVADATDKIYCATPSAFFSYSKVYNNILKYSKVSGLSDVGVNTIAYTPKYKTLVVAYNNSNIDLLKENEIVNIADLKRASLTGDKSIYHIDFIANYAYLSCGFGIVVVDMLKNEIKDTYYIGAGGTNVKVNAVSSDSSRIFAATEQGVYVASLSNPNLSSYTSWKLQGTAEKLPAGNSSSVVFYRNKIYTSASDSIFVFDGTQWNYFYSDYRWNTLDISANAANLVVAQDSAGSTTGLLRRIVLLDESGAAQKINYVLIPRTTQSVQDSDGTIWVADTWYGLGRIKDGQVNFIIPNGPGSSSVTQMDVFDNELWVAPGSVSNNWNYLYNRDGFFSFISGEWKTYNANNYPVLTDSMLDIITVAVNPADKHVFFSSYGSGGGGGIAEYNPATQGISVHKFNTSLQGHPVDNNSFRISGLAFDKENNLWVSNYGAPYPISVRKSNGSWKAFDINNIDLSARGVTSIIVDQNNYKWILLQADVKKGILVYSHGTDIDNPADDSYVRLYDSIYRGNLPSQNIKCIAEDLDGEIWVGTDKGIAVFYCGSQIFYPGGCDAQQILVEQDGYWGYLMENEIVNAIAVDGANRKWIGTRNGVWLMSADGTKQVLYFNENNSPLLSNEIKNIAINHKSGEVFFGTEKGICSYRSDATLGEEEHGEVYVFPNPVRQGYQGTIAIKGLVQNAYVKITDINGVLVYQAKALGGQAVWDGRNYKGEKPKTGVYLVFSSNEDGSETFVTKFLMVN